MRRLVAAYSHRRTTNELALAFIGVVLAVMNLGLGMSLLRAEPPRTSAPSFDVIKDAAPIHWWAWGFMTTGVLALLTQITMRLIPLGVVHAVAGVLCLFWAGAFKLALINPSASVTGPWAYAALGLVHLAVGGACVVEAWFEDRAGRLAAAASDG